MTASLPTPELTRHHDGYTIAPFTLEDGADIAPAFRAVYGRDYLNPVVYDPVAFAEAVATGAQLSFVARDANGNFVGHLGLIFSAENKNLVELTQGIMLPEHRRSGMFSRLMERAVSFSRDALGCQGIFGTSLTNHAVSQRVLAQSGLLELGLNVDFVPKRMLLREGVDGPQACLVQIRDFGTHPDVHSHFPTSYAPWFGELLAGANVPHAAAEATNEGRGPTPRFLQCSDVTITDLPRYDLVRVVVRRVGSDFFPIVERVVAEATSNQRCGVQLLISLSSSDNAAAVDELRTHAGGFFCAGLMPHFFAGGHHAAIMHHSFDAPYFKGVHLYSDQAKGILKRVSDDWYASTLISKPTASSSLSDYFHRKSWVPPVAVHGRRFEDMHMVEKSRVAMRQGATLMKRISSRIRPVL